MSVSWQALHLFNWLDWFGLYQPIQPMKPIKRIEQVLIPLKPDPLNLELLNPEP
jgi:hypothetical protein